MAKAKKPAAVDKAGRIAQLREEREKISKRVRGDNEKIRELSAMIRELEAPELGQTRPARTGFRVVPAKKG